MKAEEKKSPGIEEERGEGEKLTPTI